MTILYDEAQQAIATESRRVLDAQYDLQALLDLVEVTGQYDERVWETAVEQGWTALSVPEQYGGLGLGLAEMGLIAQSMGAVTAGAPFLSANDAFVQLLLAGSDEAARDAWLPRIAAGEAIGVAALGEGASPLPPIPTVTFADGKLTGGKISGRRRAERRCGGGLGERERRAGAGSGRTHRCDAHVRSTASTTPGSMPR
jgi:acyl-CoA dehydrogenase